MPALMASLKVSTRFADVATRVALSSGVVLTRVGAVLSRLIVVKLKAVDPEMPMKTFPAKSLTAPLSILT